MLEQCPYCGATFKVNEIGGGGICGACREPIDCPHCQKTVREERTTGFFKETLIAAPDSSISQYLGITDEEWDELSVELNANDGSSGDMTYCYWFEVPESISEALQNKTGWEVGQIIDDIPVWVVENNFR
ncbi:hypothetical protein ACN08N_26525 (plasmid) [Photobacterium leiognathi subsp. mandapamensis]|uniref:hypothetical protein n=1 Tax=Vibrionaceae TaxID=641 RepID=UPI0009AA98EC|nr:hypothetical protein [Vibrio parahaemolyticus]EJG2034141.1 hypothetical protein [Vibrio parahaemolyticus]